VGLRGFLFSIKSLIENKTASVEATLKNLLHLSLHVEVLIYIHCRDLSFPVVSVELHF
jgi:hypothetical protein